ncbi:MAG: NAD(P)-dependent glycerol-1-phosphate dehydrogenase [Thermoplasmatales archaeon]|nr:NAD(P)-dependent glycerol-1-phosphate dehydrogenase [Candidatus Thermoplasmatota archaeon]MDA8055012.1 NAD(P)-dependent glycerol-1-phosphate dehydrogenase [Thermoplasmatales archaeon]
MPFEKLAEMILPREVIGGHGAVEKIGEVFKKLTISKKGVIVTGKTTVKLAGEQVKGLLESSGIETDVIITGQATEENVEIVKEKTREFDAKVIIGIGGGTKIDIAKKSAFDLGLDFISIPTSASHDGVASPRATISKNGLSSSVEANMPAAIIADTEIIVTAPFRFLASGAADVLSNLPALRDWNLGHRLKGERVSSSAYAISEFAAREIINNASQIKPHVEESVWLVIKQIVFSGIAMSIAGSSRPASGSEHMFAHAVDTIKKGNGLHGELCGIGSIIAMYLHGADWVMIKNTLQTIGAPTTLDQVSLTEEDAIQALMMAHKTRPDRYTILGESGLSESAAREALRITGVS